MIEKIQKNEIRPQNKMSYNTTRKDDEKYKQQLIHTNDFRREFVPLNAI
jgi:hypothetical protein